MVTTGPHAADVIGSAAYSASTRRSHNVAEFFGTDRFIPFPSLWVSETGLPVVTWGFPVR
jgi:hypothetical protein